MEITTSRVYAAIEALYVRMKAQSWPMMNADPVQVLLGDEPGGQQLASVRVHTIPATDPRYEPRTFRRLNESFALRVTVATFEGHRTALGALQRLAELSATAEAALRDQVTGAPIFLDEVTGLDRENFRAQGAFVSLSPRVGPAETGFGGETDIDIQLDLVI